MEQESISVKKPVDYLKMFFRRKWLIIIPVVIGIMVGIIVANTLPKSYESSTLMLVEEGRVINPLVQGLAVSTSMAQRLQVLREQMLGWDRINQLIKTLHLANDVRTQQDFEDLVKKLRANIKVNLYGNSIVRISYRGRKPEEAMSIVKTITDIFIAENLKQQNAETDNAIAFINDQLVLYKKKLKQSDVSAMEDKLNTLLLDSTEKHPMVIEFRKQIEAAKKEIEGGDYELKDSAIADTNSELKDLKEELKGLREELATSSLDSSTGGENRTKLATATNEKLYKLLLLERVEKVTAEDANVNKKLYDELLKRLETAKITQRLEASKDGTRYIILDPARLPLKPVKPNKLVVLFAGFLFGMGAGVAFVFIAELLDHSFLGIEELKAYLALPVLGITSKIITEKDVKTQRARNIKIASLSVLTGTALLVVIIFTLLFGN